MWFFMFIIIFLNFNFIFYSIVLNYSDEYWNLVKLFYDVKRWCLYYVYVYWLWLISSGEFVVVVVLLFCILK